jgi:hypothetical protein
VGAINVDASRRGANARQISPFAMTAVVAAVADGTITPDEAVALSQTMESFTRSLEATHVERRRFWRGQLMIGKLKIWRRHSASGRPLPAPHRE